MFNWLKPLLAAVLMCSLLVTSSVQAAKPQQPLKAELNEKVFDDVGSLNRQRFVSDEEKTKIFKEAGWTVASKKAVYLDSNGNEIDKSLVSPEYQDPTSLSLHIWETYNDRYPSQWVVYAEWDWGTNPEYYPASFDVVGIDWNKDVMDYRSYKQDDSNVWLMDGSQRFNGTMLFNHRDGIGWFSTWVGITAKQGNTNTSSGMKYTHTYDAESKSTSFTGNASYTWGQPLTIGVSYTVNTSTIEKNWSKAAVSSFTTR